MKTKYPIAIVQIIVISVFYFPLYGQETDSTLVLMNQRFDHVYNSDRDSLRLSDFSGKLIILDFWAFNCISCFTSFPRLDELQKKYKDDVQIILVNKESLHQTDSFLKKRIKIQIPDLPMITNDSFLNRMFPHYGVPFLVYLDGKGKVLYQLGSINDSLVNRLIEGKSLSLEKPKRKKYLSSMLDTVYEKDVVFYSALSRANKNVEFSRGSRFKEGEFLALNSSSAPMLYQKIYSLILDRPIEYFSRPGRTLALYKDTADLHPPQTDIAYEEWLRQFAYHYQAYWSGGATKALYQKILDDYDRFFDYKVKIERKKVNCYVLKRIGNIDGLKTKGGESIRLMADLGYRKTEADSLTLLQNVPFEVLVDWIKVPTEFYAAPFFNDVEFEGNIDIQFPTGVFEKFQISSIRNALKPYHLDLVSEKRTAEVLVIRKKKKGK